MQDPDVQKVALALQEANSIAVACHVSPDGDALGSMIGLGGFLGRLGKQVFMSWGSAVVVPPQYAFLPGIDRIVGPDEVPSGLDCFVAIDCGDLARLEILQDKFHAAKVSVNIDHHISNDHFGEVNLVVPTAAASAELAYGIIKAMDGSPNLDEATCLYTGLVTDTGRFQYSNTTADTLRVAAELREIGVDHVKVAEEIYESSSFSYLHVLGVVLSRAKLEDGVVHSFILQDDLTHIGLDETEHFIDVLRAVQGARLAVLVKEQEGSGFKVSLRSRGEVDVSVLAQSFGGGGHAKAAGFSTDLGVDEVMDSIKGKINL